MTEKTGVPMRSARLMGRGVADTLEHLLPYTLMTLGWWLAVITIVPAPGATVTLAALTDPRRGPDRPTWREMVTLLQRNLWRGWGMTALTLPVVAVLLANLLFYGNGGSGWGVLVPLWTLLLVMSIALTGYAFVVAGLIERPVGTSVKLAAFLVGRRPLRAIALVITTVVAIVVGTALVVPLVIFLPALLAAVFNRMALDGLGLPVADPTAPTDERRQEQLERAASSRFRPYR